MNNSGLKQQAEQVAGDVEGDGGKVHLIQSDLAINHGCQMLFENVNRYFNKLNVLVNNDGGLIQRHSTRELVCEKNKIKNNIKKYLLFKILYLILYR